MCIRDRINDAYAPLAGDFGILAGFIGAPGTPESLSYAVQSEPVEIDNNFDLISGRYSNFNPDQTDIVESLGFADVLPEIYVPRPIPNLSVNIREQDPEAYNVYLIADDLTTTLVSTTVDTIDTISVESNYLNYCYAVKAQYDTGEPSDGGYGIVESRASNTACAVPFAVGDANFDSETTIEDVLTLVDFILEETIPSSSAFNNSDVNMDDELNIADVVMVVDIISGASTVRSANYGNFASLDLIPNYNTSDLIFNLAYDGGLKGLEFDIEYDSDVISLSAPSLVVMQENVVSTFNHLDEGLMKVIVFDIDGDFITPNDNNDLLKMSFNFFGDVLDESSVNINLSLIHI